MNETQFQSSYNDQTYLNPIGLLAILVLGLAMVIVPRRYAIWPMIIMSCFVSPAQRVAVFTLNFDLLRIMVIFGTVRIFLRSEWKGFVWRGLDSAMVVFAFVSTGVFLLQYATLEAVKYKLGFMYDMLGMYFLFRVLIRQKEDLWRLASGFAIISVPVALAFVVERATGRNMFSIFGGVPAETWVRAGKMRCQGAYADPITAGCYWASVMPIIAALWWRNMFERCLGVLGMLCSITIIILCASSTPLSSVILGFVGACFFVLRRHMRVIRWGALAALVGLHVVMNAPVWHLISRFDLAGGSTGYFRYVLINEFVNRTDEWWLLGARGVAHWGIPNGDIVNYYIAQAINGGIWSLLLFITLIAIGFAGIGRMWRASGSNRGETILAWALGVSLFVHCINFLGVSYFGQITMVWYLTLAIIGSLSPANVVVPSRRKIVPRIRVQALQGSRAAPSHVRS